MKLVRRITKSGGEWLTVKNTARRVISKGLSTGWKYAMSLQLCISFTIQPFASSLPPQSGLDCGKITGIGQKATRSSSGKETREKHVMLQSIHRVQGVEWFCIHAASIWAWTEVLQQDKAEVNCAIQRQWNLPRVLLGCWVYLSWFIPHQMTGRPAIGREFYWATMNDSNPLHRMSDAHPKTPLSHLL